jgi:hypothetical protein
MAQILRSFRTIENMAGRGASGSPCTEADMLNAFEVRNGTLRRKIRPMFNSQ